LIRFDFSSLRFTTSSLAGARDEACACCARREFPLQLSGSAASRDGCRILCGRNAVEIRLASSGVDLRQIEDRLRVAGEVASGIHGSTEVVRVELRESAGVDSPRAISILSGEMGLLAIVDGTRDAEKARSAVARWVGV